MNTYKKILCIDFDGTIHSYSSGWQGATTISDPPVPGAIRWLTRLVEDDRFTVAIYSSRSKEEGATDAMYEWLLAHGMDDELAAFIDFPTQKPPAHLTIDDRAIRFAGHFDTLEPDDLADFKPWNKS